LVHDRTVLESTALPARGKVVLSEEDFNELVVLSELKARSTSSSMNGF